jgi:hypothetical protein
MRKSSFGYVWLFTFTVVLALVVGWRLPAERWPMVAGVLAGVAVSIPASFAVAWLATRVLPPAQLGRRARRAWPSHAPPGPTVIVEHAPMDPDEQP